MLVFIPSAFRQGKAAMMTNRENIEFGFVNEVDSSYMFETPEKNALLKKFSKRTSRIEIYKRHDLNFVDMVSCVFFGTTPPPRFFVSWG